MNHWIRLSALAAASLCSAAFAIPAQGILHGFVTNQAGVALSDLTAHVSQIEGDIPFAGSQGLTATGEFVFTPHPGAYLVELRDEDDAVVDSMSGINIQSNITTFVSFRIHGPDVNVDDQVDVTDLLAVLADWGACPGGFELCAGDTNGDERVDVGDLLTVLAAWGPQS